MAKKVLFVCTANMDRSPTAEALLKKREGFDVQSAGTWMFARRRVTGNLIDWADLIFVMEEHHKKSILSMRPEAENKVIVLDIPDRYPRNDRTLIRLLRTRLAKHLDMRL